MQFNRLNPAPRSIASQIPDAVEYFRSLIRNYVILERSVLGLGRLYSVSLEILLELPYPDLGHVELVLDLPQVGVADWILASVMPQDILRFVHRTAERQRFPHAL